MAEIIASGGGRTHTVARHIKVDMTPLVDLAFLLITFFIFTTTIMDGKAMELIVPKDGPPVTPAESASLSFLLADSNQVFAYEGNWQKALQRNGVYQSNYSVGNGMGQLIRNKQQALRAAGRKPSELMVIFKPAPGASYGNTVNALDEVLINGVTRYALVDASPEELQYLLKR
jgi:biopolymer transport protein ExbD